MEKNGGISEIKKLSANFLKETVGLQGVCRGNSNKGFPEVCLVIAVGKELVLVWLDDKGMIESRSYKEQKNVSLRNRITSLFIGQRVFGQHRR